MTGATHTPSKPHITPISHYLGVASALFVLTILTVTVSHIDLGPWNLVVAMMIAGLKATLVALFFMHLLYDNKFYLVAFGSAIIFVTIFISLIMFDTMRRGDIYEEVARPIIEESAMYEEMRANPPAEHGDETHEDASGSHNEAIETEVEAGH